MLRHPSGGVSMGALLPCPLQATLHTKTSKASMDKLDFINQRQVRAAWPHSPVSGWEKGEMRTEGEKQAGGGEPGPLSNLNRNRDTLLYPSRNPYYFTIFACVPGLQSMKRSKCKHYKTQTWIIVKDSQIITAPQSPYCLTQFIFL